MKTRSFVRALIGVLVLAVFYGGPSLAIAAAPAAGPKPCNTCEDLCQLVDWYQQREKGIELWNRYAFSNPNRIKPPPGITTAKQIGDKVTEDLQQWADERKAKDHLPCKLAPQKPDPNTGQPPRNAPVVTDLETAFMDDSCAIIYKGQKLEGQNRKDYETDKNCKVLSDATIAHEVVHQMHCQRAFYEKNAGAVDYLNQPEVVADSEVEAWTKQRDVIRDAIRSMAGNCGWIPTKAQLNRLDSVPSSTQTKKMQDDGWKAVKALQQGKGRKVPPRSTP